MIYNHKKQYPYLPFYQLNKDESMRFVFEDETS